jgi:flagella basal body P-ring formation protein FlgA
MHRKSHSFSMNNVTGLLAVLLCLPAAAQADTTAQIVRQVDAAARQQLEQQAERMGLVDPRITLTVQPPSRPLPPCAGRIEIEAQEMKSPSHLRYAVRCADDGGWTRKMQARARIVADVVVAATDIAAGHPIGDADIEVDARDVTAVADFFADPADVIGMTGRRPLKAGDLLRKRLLATAVLVKRGDEVHIVARNQGIEVQVSGETLDSGGMGDLVRVRNLSSGTVLRARVTGAGEVEPVSRTAQ